MIEIVSIGDELLSGRTVNTNAAFICAQLTQRGWTVGRQLTLADDPALLEEGLREALARSELIIATGGLGANADG